MERYKGVFDDLDWGTVRNARFLSGAGGYVTLARIVLNGASHNLGTENGAVTFGEDYTDWRFIAPKGRWDMAYFETMTLREALCIIREDAENVPIPAWDDFFAFLGEPEKEHHVNSVLHGKTSSIRVAYRRSALPLIKGMTDFPHFASWLDESVGAAGDLPASRFINGQDLIIPMDLYTSVPTAFRFKVPAEQPVYIEDTAVLSAGKNILASYGTAGGFFPTPVLMGMLDSTAYLIYAFETMTDRDGGTVPQGCSVYDGTAYTPYDMEANPISVPYSEGMTWSYLLKYFCDVAYESIPCTTVRLRETPDTSLLSGDFTASGTGDMIFEMLAVPTDSQVLLGVICGESPDETETYVYADKAGELNGIAFGAGWSKLIEAESGLYTEPYDIAARPIELQLIEGAFSVSDEEAMNAVTAFASEGTVIKEEHHGTIYYMFRA